jgi:hypothetical protein
LHAGTYYLVCFYNQAKASQTTYDVVKTQEDYEAGKGIYKPYLEVKKPETAETINDNDMQAMTLEEYKKLIKENSELNSKLSLLMTELTIARKEIEELKDTIAELEEEGLSDGEEGGGFLGGLAAVMPTAIPLLEKFLEQQDKRIALQEMALMNRKSKPKPRIAPRPQGGGIQQMYNNFVQPVVDVNQGQQMQDDGQSDFNQIVSYFDNLFATNEEQANQELDQLQQEDVEMYNEVCDALGITEEPEMNENTEQQQYE